MQDTLSFRELQHQESAKQAPQLLQDSEQHRRLQMQALEDVPLLNMSIAAGSVIFSDAAWELQPGQTSATTGIGIFMQIDNQHARHIYVSAKSPLVSSALQAEAYGLLLSHKLADLLHIQDPTFYSDASVLVTIAREANITQVRPWNIRPLIAVI